MIEGVNETAIIIATLGGVARRGPTADRYLGKYVPLMATRWRKVFSKFAPHAFITVNALPDSGATFFCIEMIVTSAANYRRSPSSVRTLGGHRHWLAPQVGKRTLAPQEGPSQGTFASHA